MGTWSKQGKKLWKCSRVIAKGKELCINPKSMIKYYMQTSNERINGYKC